MAQSTIVSTDTSTAQRPTLGSLFINYARKVYRPLGFHKGYNFPLFVITCGALMGFALARFQYLSIDGIFMPSTIPGEQYFYQSGLRRVGIILHLATVLPAAFLVCFQFVPIIRYKAIIFHRINGYTCVILLLLGNVGAFIVVKHAVGGGPVTQALVGTLGAMVTVALILAWTNIKALQIDQHRAWMLRAWTWAASIISLRLIMMAANSVIQNWYTYWSPISCAQIFFMYQYVAGIPDSHNPTSLIYPQCADATSPVYVAISTRPEGTVGPENVAVLFHLTFGMSGFIALTIHVILLELYLALTPAESARLRQVSYERQVKAGFHHPEQGGLTATRLGDAPPGWNSPLLQLSVEKGYSSDSSDPEWGRTVNEAKHGVPTGLNAV